MAGSDDTRPKADPPCPNCGGVTTFYTRLSDPMTGNTHDLYRCTVCGLLTSRVLDEK